MSDVMWPPADKVKYMGFLSSVDVWWMVAAIAVGMLGVVTQHVLLSAPAALAIAVFGRAQLGGVRVRTRCRLRLGWLTRGDKQWSAPLKGEAGVPRMLRGVTLEAHPEEGRMVGVVRTSRRITLGWGSTSTFTRDVAGDVRFGDVPRRRRP